jgi:phage terminase large subunit-like protein
VLPRFWRPGDTIVEAEQRDGVPYRQWADAGYLTLTDGTMIDPVQIADDIADWLTDYTVPELAFDSWNAAGAAARLESLGVTVVSMAQGFATYSEPCHALEGLLMEGAIRHGGNPILRWMASQVMVQFGPNDAIRPYKPKGSGIRDDGIVALLMALSRARVHQQAEPIGVPHLW